MKRTILPIFAAMFLLMGTVYPPIISNVGRFFSVIVQYVTANYITVNSLTIGDGGTPIVAAHSAVICTTANQLAIDAGYISDAGWVGPGGAATLQVLSSAPECTAPWPVVFPCLCGPLTYGFGSGCPDGGTLGSLAGITSADAISCSPVSLQADAGAGLPVSMLASTQYAGSAAPPYAIVAADLNQDGYPDVALVIDTANHGTNVWLGQGNGTVGAYTEYGTPSSGMVSLALAPYPGLPVGAPDLVAGSGAAPAQVQVEINNGAGVFTDGGAYTVSNDAVRGIAVGNLAGGCGGDIVAGISVAGYGINVIINQCDGGGPGGFNYLNTSYVFYDAGSQAAVVFGVAIADFNGDGCNDVVATREDAAKVAVWMNQCDGGALAAVPEFFTVGTTPEYMVAASLENNKSPAYPDLVVTNEGSGTVSILLNQTDGGQTANFAAQATYTVGGTPIGLAVSDINGDGWLDVVVPGAGSATVGTLLGNGTGVLAAQVTFAAGVSGNKQVAISDLNLDGRPDFAFSSGSTAANDLSLTLNNGLYPPNVPCHAMGIPNGVQFNVTDTNPTQNLATLPVQDHVCFSIQDFGH